MWKFRCNVTIKPLLSIVEASNKSKHESQSLVKRAFPRVVSFSSTRRYLISLDDILRDIQKRFETLVSIERRQLINRFSQYLNNNFSADFRILSTLSQYLLSDRTSLSNHFLHLLDVCHLVFVYFLVDNIFLAILLDELIYFCARLLRVTYFSILRAEKIELNSWLFALSNDFFKLICNSKNF